MGKDDLQPLLVDQIVFQGVEQSRWGVESIVELLGKTWMDVETGSMLMCMCLALRREAINNTSTMMESLVDGKVCVPCGKVQGTRSKVGLDRAVV